MQSPRTTIDQAHDFLLSRINFERQSSLGYGDDVFRLDRMRKLLELLGSPHERLAIIHITGTKGKGSTAALVAAALTASGRRTGVFSSPHLEALQERMAVDGQPCGDARFAALVDQLRPAVAQLDAEAAQQGAPAIGPTYFELTTALALLHFVEQATDAVVLEVGMGGRLDSTNVCQPLVSVITSISLDHTAQLGNTLAAIAREKAGIIKPGASVVSGVTQREPQAVIEQAAADTGSRLWQLDRDFSCHYVPPRDVQQQAICGTFDFRFPAAHSFRQLDRVELNLLGAHQARNAAVALVVLDELARLGWTIDAEAVRRGFALVCWPARIEVVRRRPTVVLDTAHNTASIAALVATLAESFTSPRRTLLLAASRDKDVVGMLRELLGYFTHVVCTEYQINPRAVPAAELYRLAQAVANELGVATQLTEAPNPLLAWQQVRSAATADELICIAGSFFIAGELRPAVLADRA